VGFLTARLAEREKRESIPSSTTSRQAPATIASRIWEGVRPASVNCEARKTSLMQVVQVAP
jgi:hypothetical protein